MISTKGYNGREHSKQKPGSRILQLHLIFTGIDVEVLAETQRDGILVQDPTVDGLEEAVGVVVRDPDSNPKGGTPTSQGCYDDGSWAR